jgi:imidazolonepropionase-like amidohydrolase
VLLVLGFASAAVAQRRGAETGPTTAITGARVYTATADEPLENATVVWRGERIVSVTAGGAAPAGATVIDGTGLTVTPGLVAALSAIGLEEIELEATTRDTGHEDGEDGIRASFAAADGYNPLSVLIPVARRGGVTSVVSTPEGGLVSGTSLWADLRGEIPSEAIVDASLALHVNFDETGFGSAFGARSAAMAALREIFDAGRLYARSRAGWDRGDFREIHEGDVSRLDLERLAEAAGGDLPVVIHVSRADDITRMLALADELDLNVVLSGVEEGWIVDEEIAA